MEVVATSSSLASQRGLQMKRTFTSFRRNWERRLEGEGRKGADGPPWKIIIFTIMLMIGLVISQIMPETISADLYKKWAKCVQLLTMLCLAFIMINVGYEFDVDKSKMRSYCKDYLVAMTAAGFPWVFVAAWFLWALPGNLSWGDALLAGRFAAPTSAGILFSMLQAAGLQETWLFQKARILAIFDDLDTILLMIPLKIIVVGFKWELTIDAVMITVLMGLAWWKLHEIRLPTSFKWTMLYALLVAAFCELLHYITDHALPMEAVHLEVLLPAFVIGCIAQHGHDDDDDDGHAEEDPEDFIKTVISAFFMALVGLSMPSLFSSSGEQLGVGALLGHVFAVTVLMLLGKMFPLCCYKDEADRRIRFGLCLGMCPRGEVGAGVIVISLNLGITGPVVSVAVISLVINLVLSSGFILSVKHLVTMASAEDSHKIAAVTVTTAAHPSIKKLMEGNGRYLTKCKDTQVEKERDLRRNLSTLGQSPFAIVLSCSDSRCPTERLFDAAPGDLFVVRVAGNVCGSPVGGVIGSVEYAVEHLKSPVIMVLGHTKCGAVSAAVSCSKKGAGTSEIFGRNLGAVVGNIKTPAIAALQISERPETPEQIEHAIKLNVYHSMEQLLRWSPVIQEGVRIEALEIHGGIYDITTGQVNFLGPHPRQAEMCQREQSVDIRTGLDQPMPPPAALDRLRKGNVRYAKGEVESKVVSNKMRETLVRSGQRPFSVILGCADSRIPVDHIFDTNPGDLFVVRNAGSTCGAMAGGLVGSIEYGIGHLKSQLIVVLGHTGCGAVAAAMEAHLSREKTGDDVPEGLKCLLDRLKTPVQKAVEESVSTELADRVALAIDLNVWHTIQELIQNSKVIHNAVSQGNLQLHGAVYDLNTGCVRFMGEHPRLSEFVTPCVEKRQIQCVGDEHPAAAETVPLTGTPTGFVPLSVVPDVEKGMQKPIVAWEIDKKENKEVHSSLPSKDWFELSWIVETKHGPQHIKDVILDKNNWIAGVTVALVSVPLSIALGIASGTTPMRGLATAVFGGLCAGLFGSSDYNIVGPAGALSGMFMSYVVKYGEDVLPWLSIISAMICLASALLRLDTYMLLMPTSVFEGFTVGVALIIGLNQINFACGLIPGKKHALFVMNIFESIKTLGETKPASLIVFLLQAPTLWFLMRKIPKIPWTVILPVVSIVLGLLCDGDHLGFDLLTLKSKYGLLKPELIQPLRKSDASFTDMLIPSFSIAIVAILETLISAKIAAGRVDRPFNELKELRGLVVCHAVCGAVGAMPPTGVFVRTSLNTSLGATHRFSQFLNATVVAMISLALMPLFSYLPQATIAAILVVASIRMTPMTYLRKLWAEDKGALALCLVTAAICVGEDPVIGLAAGMVMALLARAKTMLQSPFVDIKSKRSDSKRTYTVSVHGAITYVNAEMFIEKTRNLENAAEIAVDLSAVRQVDHDGVSALGKVSAKWKLKEKDCNVRFEGVGADIYPALSKMPWFTDAEDKGQVHKAQAYS